MLVLTLDAVFLLNVRRTFNCLLIAVVPDGNVGTGLGKGLSHGQANAGTRTRDNGGLALVGEQREHLVLLGSRGVSV